ncbi:MAG TPA: hypothetical protein VN222_11505 [Novosphingobium sp.]|nr:hypothetical protein [Novosphingobium sp.]
MAGAATIPAAQAQAASPQADALANAARQHWQAVHADPSIQFAPLPNWLPPGPPGWLQALGRWLAKVFEPVARALGMSWPVLEKLLIALAVVGVLALVWQIAAPLYARWRARPAPPAPAWAPDQEQARALLEEADRLAAQGDYDAAAHLLLLRSFEHIATARPEWLGPASTAREIAHLPALPGAARAAFARIAALVEASRYALRPLAAPDWHSAREAYAAFALQRLAAA